MRYTGCRVRLTRPPLPGLVKDHQAAGKAMTCGYPPRAQYVSKGSPAGTFPLVSTGWCHALRSRERRFRILPGAQFRGINSNTFTILGRPGASPRARALAAAADLIENTGGYAIAEEYCEEALAIARAANDDYLAAEVLQIRAWPLLRQGQPGAALPLIESGLGLARRLGEPHLTGLLLSARSFALNIGGNPATAARDAAESLRLFRQAGDQLLVGAMLGNLGIYELSAGDLDAACRHLAEALAIARAELPLRHRLRDV